MQVFVHGDSDQRANIESDKRSETDLDAESGLGEVEDVGHGSVISAEGKPAEMQ
jgi:hypothetical protein